MEFETILYEKRDAVAVVTLNRPSRLNAVNPTMSAELYEALKRVQADDDVRALIITGGPRPDGRPLFSAGADLKDRAQSQPAASQDRGARTVNRLDEFPKPTIAVIDGFCTTAGTEIALACDFRIVAETAQICDWHLKNLGLGLGGWGAAERLVRLVGPSNAKDIILTGRVIDGHEAYRMGFANRVFPSERLMEESLRFAQQMADKSPRGVAVTLAYIDQATEMQKYQALHWVDTIVELTGVRASMAEAARRLESRKDKPAG